MCLKQINSCMLVLLGSLMLFAACNSNDRVKVPADIEDALYDRYPTNDISALEWSLMDGFFVGECRMDGYYCKVWFDACAHWYMTETCDIVYKSLPETVKNHFDAIGDRVREIYRVDFDYLESRYVIESKDKFFFYREKNGEHFKTVEGAWTNSPIVIDGNMLRYVEMHCDSVTTIVDADMKTMPLRLDIYEVDGLNARYKTVYFDTPAMWLATVWKIQKAEVSAEVLKQVEAVADESRWESVYRVEHQRVNWAYGFRLKDGAGNLYFNDNGEQVFLDEVPLQ